MRDYNQNSRSGGGRFGGGGDFRRRDSGRRQMHQAVCSECGKDCEVPFRPSGDKPIFCSSCFESRDGRGPRKPGRKSFGGPSFQKRDDTNKQLLEQVGSLNTKLDRILKILEPKIVGKTKTKKVTKKTVSKPKKTKAKKTSKKKESE